MGKQALIQKRWDGGLGTDEQLGIPHSHAYSRHLEFRKKPSQISVLPETRQEGEGVIVDLLQNEVMTNDGTVYALGNLGYFYKRTTAGVWSNEAKLDSGTFGLSYRKDTDAIYLTSAKTASEYSPISNSPSIKLDKFTASRSTDSNAYLTGGSKTYPLTTTISESTSEKQEYQPDIEPLMKIGVMIVSKGTGDWKLTVHDAANNTLGSKTVANADLKDRTMNYFEFSSQIRQYVKPNARTYHFHLTSTVADGTIACSTAGDLNTADYEYWADRFVQTNNGMHPQETFLQYQCFGNERYLSVWEPLSEVPTNAEWLRHKLTFPPGLEVCGLARWNEYLAIACEQKTTSTSVTPQAGYIFFWDGLATTYNFFIPVPEGSPYALHEHKNVLKYFAGGTWHAYAGGVPVKLRTMPFTDSEYTDAVDQTIVYPYTATVHRGIHMFGFPSSTTNQSLEFGVYSYGAVDKNFTDSFGYSYTCSHGTINYDGSNNLRLGMVKSFGDFMHISWRKGDEYGLDIVDNTSDPFSTATWESLVFEDEIPTKLKSADYIEATLEGLPTGASIALKYKIDGGSWVTQTAKTTEGLKYIRFDINDRFYDIQVGIELAAESITPVVKAIVLVYDDNKNERLG